VCKDFLVKYGESSSSSLHDYIAFHNQRVPISHALLIFKHLATGLADCHKKRIVHGDIKVENVLIGMSLFMIYNSTLTLLFCQAIQLREEQVRESEAKEV
jgi:serine/threonine protein kinase